MIQPFSERALPAIMAMARQSAETTGMHFDANESAIFARQLTFIEGQLYPDDLRKLKYRDVLPIDNSADPGAETIVYHRISKVGLARIIASSGRDLPRADVMGAEYTARVRTLGTSFGFSFQDLRRNAMVVAQGGAIGSGLDALKAESAGRAIDELENNIAFNGDTTYGLQGFLNHANIPLIQAALDKGTSTDRTWTGGKKTPDEILADVVNMVNAIRVNSKQSRQGDTLLLPLADFTYITSVPRSTQSDTTIADFILNNRKAYGITNIDTILDLTGAGAGGVNRAVLYEYNPKVVALRIPMERVAHTPTISGLEMEVAVESRCAGTVVRYPLACVYMDGL